MSLIENMLLFGVEVFLLFENVLKLVWLHGSHSHNLEGGELPAIPLVTHWKFHKGRMGNSDRKKQKTNLNQPGLPEMQQRMQRCDVEPPAVPPMSFTAPFPSYYLLRVLQTRMENRIKTTATRERGFT